VNVAEIMAQIRRRIEQKKRDLKIGTELEDLAAMRLRPLPDQQQVKALRTPELYPGANVALGETIATKTRAPAQPLVDPFTRPPLEFEKPNVSTEVLFYSSRGGFGRVLMVIRSVTRPILKLFMNLDAYVSEQAHVNQVLRNQTVSVYERVHQQIVDLRDRDDQVVGRVDATNESLRTLADMTSSLLAQTVHYVKLLHGIQTSLVAELSKLAIENQTLRSRLAELDDRLAIQGKREAILEEQVQQIEDACAPPREPAGPAPEGAGTEGSGDRS